MQRKSRRKIVELTLNFERPGRIPRQLWMSCDRDKLKKTPRWRKFRLEFPDDLVFCPPFPCPEKNQKLKKNNQLIYEWDSIFQKKPSQGGDFLISSTIKPWPDLKNWPAPESLLKINKDKVNAFCRSTDRFVLAGTWIRLFEQLQFLRGPKELFLDLKTQPPEFFEWLRQVHEFNLKILENWAQTEIDGLCLMDDWGGQKSLFISPALFRQLFKPLYQEYAAIAQKYHKYLFLHSDGYIIDLLPDFIEIGIKAINCQVRLMEPKKLASFRGQITFWGSSDLPAFFSQAKPKEIVNYCQEIYECLWANGGFIAQIEATAEIKISALRAYFAFWKKFL